MRLLDPLTRPSGAPRRVRHRLPDPLDASHTSEPPDTPADVDDLGRRVAVRAEAVAVRIGSRAILQSVDLTVRVGEVVALVGPNGAGKSTLLSVLAGDTVPEHGTVALDGADIRSWSPTELAMRRGVLLQQLTMSFPFTVRQTVEMGRAPWIGTVAEESDDEAVASAMESTDITHLADRRFTSLSGGERARAGLARVIAQDTRLLLLDEPTAALDVRHQEQVLELARSRSRAGCAVVVVLHDLGVAAAHADRVVVLTDGRVRADGAPGDVLEPQLLSDVYQHPIEVVRHPATGMLVVLPVRAVERFA